MLSVELHKIFDLDASSGKFKVNLLFQVTCSRNVRLPIISLQPLNSTDLEVIRLNPPEASSSLSTDVSNLMTYYKTLEFVGTFNFHKFPFDKQILEMAYLIGSSSSQPGIIAMEMKLNEMPNWSILQPSITHRNYAQGDHFTIKQPLERRSIWYYIYKRFIIVCLLSLASLSVYRLRQAPRVNKLTLVMTLTLSTITYLLSLSNDLPKLNYLTMPEEYAYSCIIGLCITMVLLSFDIDNLTSIYINALYIVAINSYTLFKVMTKC